MATITMTVNNTPKTFKSPKTLEVYADLLTVDNVGAKGLQEAVTKAGGLAFVASILAAGSPDDTFEITKEITSKGTKGIITGKTTRAKLAKRIEFALQADSFAVEIVRVFDGKTQTTDNGESWEMEAA